MIGKIIEDKKVRERQIIEFHSDNEQFLHEQQGSRTDTRVMTYPEISQNTEAKIDAFETHTQESPKVSWKRQRCPCTTFRSARIF